MSAFQPPPSTPPLAPPSGAPARAAVLPLGFRDKPTLLASYISLFDEGGVFMPAKDDYQLGDEIHLLLSLPDDPERHPVTGRIAWITPQGAGYGRLPGVGVRFPADESGRRLKARIERLLGGLLSAERPTLTL